ncbi:MAG: nuclear transport factor 2 family protein [Patulibacter sp.]|nr:nuclear transport factor 2 family protein [Patulibacter sp.]
MTTQTIDTTIATYLAAWNELDPQRREALIARTWTEDGDYLDPQAAAAGHDAISALIGAVQEQFPGHRFVLASGPDAHNDRVRFTWHLVGDAGPVAVGIDFATVADDGRLRSVTGFLEQP